MSADDCSVQGSPPQLAVLLVETGWSLGEGFGEQGQVAETGCAVQGLCGVHWALIVSLEGFPEYVWICYLTGFVGEESGVGEGSGNHEKTVQLFIHSQ